MLTHASAIPRKVPQTLVYGIRQARAALEQAPVDQVQQVLSPNEQSMSKYRKVANANNFLQLTCPRSLHQGTVANIMSKIIEKVGEDDLKLIANTCLDQSLSELPEDQLYGFGMMEPVELGVQDSMGQILYQTAREKMSNVNSITSSSNNNDNFSYPTSRNPMEDSLSEVDFNSDPRNFEDVTHHNRIKLMFMDYAEPAMRAFKNSCEWLKGLLMRCFEALKSLINSMFTDVQDKRKVEYTLYGVFFAAAYSCEISLLQRFQKPWIINDFRKTIMNLALEIEVKGM